MYAYRFHRAAFLLAGLLVSAIHASSAIAQGAAAEPAAPTIPTPVEITLVASPGRTLSTYERGFADGFRARSLMGRSPAIYRQDQRDASRRPYWRSTPSNRGWGGATRETYGWRRDQRRADTGWYDRRRRWEASGDDAPAARWLR